FREDLYFRLNVIRIEVPSLGKRKEDVPALAEAFLREVGRPLSALSPRALERLLSHEWPGNVRELKHTIERAVLLAGAGPIETRHLGLDERAPPEALWAQTGKTSFHGIVLNRRQLALVDFLRANGIATNREYVKLVHVSVPTGWRDLNDLVSKGVVTTEGSARSTIYRLAAGIERKLGKSPTTDAP
ncbi:hypothetical protein HY251_13945, partial [bacterium]|nr:hypothetical protein [bacterium]